MRTNVLKNRCGQRGSVHISLVIVIIAAVVVIISSVGAAYAFSNFNALRDTIARSDELSSEERHSEAIVLLQPTQDSWLVNLLGVREAEITARLEKLETTVRYQGIYQQAVEKGHEGEWEAVIELLSRIPDDSFYHHKAELKTAEARRNILESRLEAAQTAREAAERTAALEEQARLAAEAKANEEARKRAAEETARKVAEAKATEEALMRAKEEEARQAAEQEAERQRMANEQQQRATEFQRHRAEQEEKAKVLELAQTHPLIKAIVAGELKFYIEPLPTYASVGVASAVEEVASSFASWTSYGATIRRVYSANNADLTISWIRDYGSHTIGESIYRAHVKVGLGSNNCVGEWRAFDSNTVKKVLWHELGHSMGYGHSSDPNNVMYFQTATRFEIENEISEIIAGGWYLTFPLCGTGTYSYSFETEDPNTGFDLFILPPSEDPQSISRGGGSVYVGCGEEGMHRFLGSCIVSHGASIYIANTSCSRAIRLSGKVESLEDQPWPDMTWDEEAYHYDGDELESYWELFH